MALAWANNRVSEPLAWPTEMRGLVRSPEKRPVAGAKIVLEIKVQLWPLGGLYEKTVYQDETVSDAEGRFVFKTAGIPAIRRRPIVATVTASAADRLTWQTWWWYSPQSNKGEARFVTMRLASGAHGERSGRGCGRSARGRRRAARLRHEVPGRPMGGRNDQDGHPGPVSVFALRPVTGSARGLVLHAVRRNSSSCRKTRARSKSSWSEGPRLTECCLRKILKPAAGVLVAAESFNNGASPTRHLPYRLATRTDGDGRFHFPPLTGEYRFFVTEAAESMDANGFLETNNIPLSVAPKTETFADAESRRVTLYAGDSSKVEGTVRWDDGSPAAGSIVAATMMPAGNGPGLQLAHSLTDASGHYELRLPEFVERVDVRVDMQKRNGQSFRALTSDDKEYIQLNEISSRGHRVDFTFRP